MRFMIRIAQKELEDVVGIWVGHFYFPSLSLSILMTFSFSFLFFFLGSHKPLRLVAKWWQLKGVPLASLGLTK
jgi:hypothetical protein